MKRITDERNQEEFQPIYVNVRESEVVKSAVVLGLIVTSDFLKNVHIKKAAKRPKTFLRT